MNLPAQSVNLGDMRRRSSLNPDLPEIQDLLRAALAEDIGPGDVTSNALIPEDLAAIGTFAAKEDGVVAGLPLLRPLFTRIDPDAFVKTLAADGDAVRKGTRLAEVYGSARALLAGERTALNFLQHLSGIATQTRRFVRAARKTRCRILDTRKTLPGMRLLEKHAVRTGGGDNHRIGLFDQVLVKDNHIALAKRPASSAKRGASRFALRASRSAEFYRQIVQLARKTAPRGSPIEIEVTTPDEALAAGQGGADILLLDNMSLAGVRKSVRLVRGLKGHRPLLEVSGGVTLAKVGAIAATGVDRISVGALTHSAPALDIAMDLRPIPPAGGARRP